MSFAECYLDETETTGPRRYFAVAGIIFKEDAAVQHANCWKKMLSDWSLPYFHMSECVHRVGVFARLDRSECDLAARKAIQIIRQHASAFIYVTIELSTFEVEEDVLRHFGGPYEFCALSVMPAVSMWCAKNTDVTEVRYFFESGATGQSNASVRIAEMIAVDSHREQCRFQACLSLTNVSRQISRRQTWSCGIRVKTRKELFLVILSAEILRC